MCFFRLWHWNGRVNFSPRKTILWTWYTDMLSAYSRGQQFVAPHEVSSTQSTTRTTLCFLLSCHVSMPWTQPNTRGLRWKFGLIRQKTERKIVWVVIEFPPKSKLSLRGFWPEFFERIATKNLCLFLRDWIFIAPDRWKTLKTSGLVYHNIKYTFFSIRWGGLNILIFLPILGGKLYVNILRLDTHTTSFLNFISIKHTASAVFVSFGWFCRLEKEEFCTV